MMLCGGVSQDSYVSDCSCTSVVPALYQSSEWCWFVYLGSSSDAIHTSCKPLSAALSHMQGLWDLRSILLGFHASALLLAVRNMIPPTNHDSSTQDLCSHSIQHHLDLNGFVRLVSRSRLLSAGLVRACYKYYASLDGEVGKGPPKLLFSAA
jgi:hypothetical protein